MIDRFTCDDLLRLTDCVADAWTAGADRDWSAPAGTLEWSCTKTADHAVDCVLAPAFFLASRKQHAYPDGGWSPAEDPSPEQLVEALRTATRVLTAVVRDAPADVRAIIWRRPVETRPAADFVPRGALELILHAHDVCTGLDSPLEPPTEVCEHLRQHTRAWPFWSAAPGWSPLTMTGDPWVDLLRASGRLRA